MTGFEEPLKPLQDSFSETFSHRVMFTRSLLDEGNEVLEEQHYDYFSPEN